MTNYTNQQRRVMKPDRTRQQANKTQRIVKKAELDNFIQTAAQKRRRKW